MLLLQEFEFVIIHTPGKEHAVADYLSRLETGESPTGVDDQLLDANLFSIQQHAPKLRYDQMLVYLTDGVMPGGFSPDQRKKFALKSRPCFVIARALYKKGIDQVIRRCVPEFEQSAVLQEAHYGQASGHFLGDITGPMMPTSSRGNRYILVATDYCTKWVEAVALKDNKAASVPKFLYHNIMTRFGCPVELVSDRGTHFLNEVIQDLTKTHMILHKKSTPYHPQANGQAESSKTILVKFLKKIVQEDHKDWDLTLDSALCSLRTAFKVTTGMTPFKLVYGLEAVVPMEFVVPSLRVFSQKMSPALSVKHRCKYLMQLEEDML
ncbi:hypothetical protein L7F22_028269 [Adiantum nelumboides]|nr:hypothetical protein [Adiantum nelumboides]